MGQRKGVKLLPVLFSHGLKEFYKLKYKNSNIKEIVINLSSYNFARK